MRVHVSGWDWELRRPPKDVWPLFSQCNAASTWEVGEVLRCESSYIAKPADFCLGDY